MTDQPGFAALETTIATEMVDSLGLPFSAYWLAKAKGQNFCPRCEGDGSYTRLADCTTWGSDCACHGPGVNVDPCPLCGGSGEFPLGGRGEPNTTP